MARLLNRPASTISRELRRNSIADRYTSGPAQQAHGLLQFPEAEGGCFL